MSNGNAAPLVVQAAVEGADLAGAIQPANFQPGTVVTYSEAPPARALVRPELSKTEIPAKNLTGVPLYPGTRVWLGWTDGQCEILATIGRVPVPYGKIVRSTSQAILDNTPTTLGWATPPQAVYGGMVLETPGWRLPFTALWSVGLRTDWDADPPGTTPGFVHERHTWIERMNPDGVTVIEETDAKVQTYEWTRDGNGRWFEVQSVSTPSWPGNAGEFFRPRVKQGKPFGGGVTCDLLSAKFVIEWVSMCDDVMT